jgi:hypothetical protein
MLGLLVATNHFVASRFRAERRRVISFHELSATRPTDEAKRRDLNLRPQKRGPWVRSKSTTDTERSGEKLFKRHFEAIHDELGFGVTSQLVAAGWEESDRRKSSKDRTSKAFRPIKTGSRHPLKRSQSKAGFTPSKA